MNNKLLLVTDSEGKTAWQLVAEKSNLELLHGIWKWVKEKLTTQEINKKFL